MAQLFMQDLAKKNLGMHEWELFGLCLSGAEKESNGFIMPFDSFQCHFQNNQTQVKLLMILGRVELGIKMNCAIALLRPQKLTV